MTNEYGNGVTMEKPTLKHVIEEYGKRNGFDGVCCPGCGCAWGDFPVCGDICTNATFGYLVDFGCGEKCISDDGTCPGVC